jgi:hypothetical protein
MWAMARKNKFRWCPIHCLVDTVGELAQLCFMHMCPRCEYTCDCDGCDLWNDAAAQHCQCDCDCEDAWDDPAEQDRRYYQDNGGAELFAELYGQLLKDQPSWFMRRVVHALLFHLHNWISVMMWADDHSCHQFWQNLSPYYQAKNEWTAPWIQPLPDIWAGLFEDDDHPF